MLVPPKAGDGRPLIAFGRWSYFTERETQIICNRVLLDDPRKARGHIQISRSEIWNTVKQPRILQHVFLTLVSMSGFQGLTQYTPSMIKSLGFGAIRANALASIPVYCGIVWLTILSLASYVSINLLRCQIAHAAIGMGPTTVDRSCCSPLPGMSSPTSACGQPHTPPGSGTGTVSSPWPMSPIAACSMFYRVLTLEWLLTQY